VILHGWHGEQEWVLFRRVGVALTIILLWIQQEDIFENTPLFH